MVRSPFKIADTNRAPKNPEDGEIRRLHIETEAGLRAMGTVLIIIGVLGFLAIPIVLIGMTGIVIVGLSAGTLIPTEPGKILFLIIPVVLALVLGAGLRALSGFASLLMIILCLCALLIFPIGTILGFLTLCLLLSPKGRFVVTPEYRKIVAATPEVRSAGSPLMMIFLVMLLGVLLFALTIAYLFA